MTGLPANQETYELMNEMLDATKLRIMLLEKRNKQYRALQMKQGNSNPYDIRRNSKVQQYILKTNSI